MLLVRTTIGPSQIHGIDLFAAESIAVGTMIWRFDPRFDLLMRKDEIPSSVDRYTFSVGITGFFCLSGDDDRFVNHSNDPNMQYRVASLEAVAIHDIQEGDEITQDYLRDFGEEAPNV